MPDAVKERPILFSGEMVRAILEGRKTQTRRVMKPQPPVGNWRYDGLGDMDEDDRECHWLEELDESGEPIEVYRDIGKCPYGAPGDRLWVQEDFFIKYDDGAVVTNPAKEMPNEMSRIALEITGVRVERLHDISEDDAIAEGCEGVRCHCDSRPCTDCMDTGWLEPPTVNFMQLWDSLAKVGKKWEDNPFCWVIEFRRVENAKA
jgi:hypothetical protein